MANNTYGIQKPSLLDIEKDVEIWYHYRPTRNSEDDSFPTFRKIDTSDVVAMLTASVFTNEDNANEILPGMFNFKLPISLFGKKGFYTIFIKPREYRTTIISVGALAAYPEINGIVIPKTINERTFSEDELVGYRVEYYNGQGVRQEYYRIITGNNYCVPVTQNLTSVNSDVQGYRFSTSSDNMFLTLTPSTSPSFKQSSRPYIGVATQEIILSNTKFDPLMIEIEMCEHDIDEIANIVGNTQVRSLDKGVISTFNDNNEMILQHSYYTLKSSETGKDLYEVKRKMTENFQDMEVMDEVINQ